MSGALGTIVAATAVGVVPAAPGPNMCWFSVDLSQRRGYWDYCQVLEQARLATTSRSLQSHRRPCEPVAPLAPNAHTGLPHGQLRASWPCSLARSVLSDAT
jgi:hypothetical protein